MLDPHIPGEDHWDNMYAFPGAGIAEWLGRYLEQDTSPVPVSRVLGAMRWWRVIPGGLVGNLANLCERCVDPEAPELEGLMKMFSHFDTLESYLESLGPWVFRFFIISIIDFLMHPNEEFGPQTPFLHPGKAARGFLTLIGSALLAPGVYIHYNIDPDGLEDFPLVRAYVCMFLGFLLWSISYTAIRDWTLCLGALFYG